MRPKTWQLAYVIPPASADTHGAHTLSEVEVVQNHFGELDGKHGERIDGLSWG